MVKTMKMKKALAGILLSLGLAGGIVTPASVAFATDETTSVAPATEVVAETPATEAPAPVAAEVPAVAEAAPADRPQEQAKAIQFAIVCVDDRGNFITEPIFTMISPGDTYVVGAPPSIEGWEFQYSVLEFGTKVQVGDVITYEMAKSEAGLVYIYKPATEAVAPVYRLYQPDLKVHLYTKDTNEYKVLATRGWKQEGISWRTETQKGDAVYRLYHPDLKVHLYTKDTNENKVLATRGWKQEGVAYRSFGSVPVYRLYHAGIRKHLYTKDANEYKVLATRGWLQEGVAWYSQP